MKSKILSVSLLTAILLAFSVSAASFTVSPTTITFSQTANTTELIIKPTNDSTYFNISSFEEPTTIKDNAGNILTFSFNPLPPLNNINITRKINISSFPDYSKLSLGKTYSGTLKIKTNNVSDYQEATIKFVKSFCSSGDARDNLTIYGFDVDNNDGNDYDWEPLDDIEVKIKVENKNPDSGEKIDTIVKIALYDSEGKEYLDLDEVDLGKIKGGGKETATFNFKVPTDIGVVAGRYFLYAKAYEDGGESRICTSKIGSDYFKEVEVSREDEDDRQVIVDDIQVTPGTALCGEEVSISAKVYNIGENDQDKVKTRLVLKELGVDLYSIISSGLDEGDSELVEFTFIIPKNATEKRYTLDFRNLYDYDDDYKAEEDAAYDQYSEIFPAYLKVEGNCVKIVTKKADISATLETADENVKAGKDVIIKATIKNTGNETTSYIIGLEGSELFSSIKSINPSNFSLEAGKSQDVLITLSLNKDAEGDKVFSIKAIFDSKETKQQVSLSIPKSGLSGFSMPASIKDNWFIWVIVAINIILIIAIIIVAVRVSRA